MSLFSVFGTSTAGLKSIQDSLSLVSQNVAGANTPGYVRRVQTPISGTPSSGAVVNGQVERILDKYVQRSYWQSLTGSGYSSQFGQTLTDVNSLFGVPGADSGLPNLMSKFQNALKTLVTDPSSTAGRAQVIGQINLLVNSIHSVSDGIQSIRANTESAISNDVDQLNTYLQQIDGINQKIGVTDRDPGLLDQRDQLVGKLSSLIGISVKEQADGTVQITTDTGAVLLDQSGVAKFAFDSRGDIQASDQYNIDPTKRRVGTIMMTAPGGTTVDLLANGLVKSGELGALIDLRDHSLVEAQSQIDDLAASLASIFSDHDVQGTTVPNGQSLDLTDFKSGNRIHLSYTDSTGKQHKVSLVGVNGSANLPLPADAARSDGEDVIGFDMSGGPSGMASAIQAALNGVGAGMSVAVGSGSVLNFTATAPATLDGLSARVTDASLGANSKGLPLFTDGSDPNSLFTDSYDGKSQRTGFASRITLNALIKSDPSLLVTWGGTSTSTGNTSHATALYDAFVNEKRPGSAQSNLGLSGGAGKVTDILTQFIQRQSIDASNAKMASSSATVTMNYMEAKFNSVSGVNIDTELASMTGLQAAYTANARVLTTAREMLDVLMRI